MCEIKLHVKLPIFVARQWIRHRTASVNENSARYSVLDREFYLPRPEDLAVQSANNKQGRGEVLSVEAAAEVLQLLRRDAEGAYDTYERLLDDHHLARELARMNLPVNWYTQWYWKVDLHNLLHFLSLRIDPHAQYEIRVYGEAIARAVKAWVPGCWEAFEDYRLGAVTLSRPMLEVVRRMLAGESPSREDTGLSGREWDELMEVLGR
jgi:thymidylate synthase (FAD)